ncbi:putative hydrolase [Kluyveromyces lactis]|uniref:KLLA0E15247p n=1 Tax=Kluyveromyces lactis (strain ATCC 8585 / CBS 2359 / DSM 70799 / NBRC 1267 / NRRL Y-1140 / WM37) TaxID=284590 RepID=Q6CN52_KLULA|nr:uncharacterized protein KLLA0_E15247g [Kluyveromyces lactis]7ELF_A Chain A, KLLA0E15247p [Kluyveromyces lactis NRRL Y-1140]7ELF_B Chain B, KLLA0E15247p [Kluyveromyces lactis NRRL Y-1140]7ELF_C Chain C, KLLA0E15247p [Kluyveromyces lactis NRRL Y-1140]7ELF_D Chain D, KLLA0E15247p [Kluyveromyces lactis NRRL Y-1140]CAG99724.1 KLLA0E15247p [Kluyveromyces lactis]|eukprot:XP_454637.1 uncharacterized protein KLLA0_E15247g [Kluyveromyces lactis]
MNVARIGIGQLCSSSNLKQNLEVVKSLIKKALDQDVKVLFFPEATDYLSRNAEHSKKLASQTPEFISELQSAICQLTKAAGKPIDISIGIHMPPSEVNTKNGDSRVKNVLLYINSNGEILQKYQKLHLFDVDVPNGPILKESNSVQPGSEIPSIINTPVGKLGSCICYDIRFPELSLKLRSKGAQILCFPSAFTMKTGEAHWELLGRARAIDTQSFVVMPAQQGEHDVYADEKPSDESAVKRISWGHSMIIDPWGRILSAADLTTHDPQLIIADLDIEAQDKIRRDMPLWAQRRRDIFGDFV